MICRMWHGKTPRSKADTYAALLEQRALSGYRAVRGNLSAYVLRRDEAEVTHFMTVTYWESEECVRAFTGDDVLTARYFPEDEEFLLEFEPFVQHYMVAAEMRAT